MPITENVNGVLHTHSVELENVGGIIREKDYVHANDGGVLHEIHSANKGATVSGITPLVVADDHIVIVNSGSFTLSAPAGTRIIVGGAAKGTTGGNVAEYTLESAIKNAQCTVQCGAVNSGGATILTISGTTYNSGSVKRIIQSKWGPIGGDGGDQKCGGSGAGGGGGGNTSDWVDGGAGGNNDGYGNYGGHGGRPYGGPHASIANGEDGASGKGGSYDTSGKYCGGGGGGFSAGGGKGASGYVTNNSGNTVYATANPGEGGAGIIVIEYN